MFGRHGEDQLGDVVGHVAIAAVGANKHAAPGGAGRPLVGLSDDADVGRATEILHVMRFDGIRLSPRLRLAPIGGKLEHRGEERLIVGPGRAYAICHGPTLHSREACASG